jgi:enoyl-CoA hydratase
VSKSRRGGSLPIRLKPDGNPVVVTASATDPQSAVVPAASAIGVRFQRAGAGVVAVLDRPARLNAIDAAMKAALTIEIPRIARDPQVYAVILRAAPARMFCAGGDIRELYDLVLRSRDAALAECAREYSLIWLFDCFSKPTVALMDGAVLGTGAGIVQSLTHRVAAAGYRFQMPETAIGYFPDNGVSWHLAKLPHEIGTWLGLTGTAIERADAYWLGLLTHCIDAEHFAEISAEIADAQPIDPVLDTRHADPGTAPLAALAPTIQRCFGASSVMEIMARLAASRDNRAWCQATLAALAERSPTALEVTLQLIRRARSLDLRQTLTIEYRLARHLVVGHDFLEGVRARIIEKSGQPRWRPAVTSDVGVRGIERLFEPMTEGELTLPTRMEMQASRV